MSMSISKAAEELLPGWDPVEPEAFFPPFPPFVVDAAPVAAAAKVALGRAAGQHRHHVPRRQARARRRLLP